jgi:hypothetical protein
MKKDIEKLVKKIMDFYETSNMIVGLNIDFVSGNSPMHVSKGIYNTAWLISKRDMEFVKITEGESIAINRLFELSEKTIDSILSKITDFLAEKNIPVKLNIIVNTKECRFDIYLIQLK